MSDQEIRNILIQSIKKLRTDDLVVITDETKFIGDLGFESIEFVDLVFELEIALKVNIDLNLFALELSRFKFERFSQVTVLDLFNFVKRSLANHKS